MQMERRFKLSQNFRLANSCDCSVWWRSSGEAKLTSEEMTPAIAQDIEVSMLLIPCGHCVQRYRGSELCTASFNALTPSGAPLDVLSKPAKLQS